jgi:hypothetical protein
MLLKMIDGKRKENEITQLAEENPLFYSAGYELLRDIKQVFSCHYLKLVDLSISFANFLLR